MGPFAMENISWIGAVLSSETGQGNAKLNGRSEWAGPARRELAERERLVAAPVPTGLSPARLLQEAAAAGVPGTFPLPVRPSRPGTSASQAPPPAALAAEAEAEAEAAQQNYRPGSTADCES